MYITTPMRRTLYRIMLNEIFRFLKKEKACGLLLTPLGDHEETLPGNEDAYEDVDLKNALDKLPAKDKAVIELKYFEELTFEEIAGALEENVNTVKSRLYRGLKKLKLDLSDAWQWE